MMYVLDHYEWRPHFLVDKAILNTLSSAPFSAQQQHFLVSDQRTVSL